MRRSSSGGADDEDSFRVWRQAYGMVRVWRLADGTPVAPPLELPGSVQSVVVHGDIIVTATGADIAVHQPALPRPMR